MKLKYYMRGLGIGMVVTALLLSVIPDKNAKAWTDEEVRARAKELGMVESTVLSQLPKQEKNSETAEEPGTLSDPEKENSGEKTENPEKETGDNKEPETGESQIREDKKDQNEGKTQEGKKDQSESQTRESTEEELITIEILWGESSESVSRSLEEAGLVSDAKEFDKYLCANGYDKKISVGTYKILAGATEKEIADIISKGR